MRERSSATGINGSQTDNNSLESGAAYLFVRSDLLWQQQAYIKASNSGEFDFFGTAVSLSGDGNTLAVGAIYESSLAQGIDGNQLDNSSPVSGAVYLFTREAVDWSQQAYLKASNSGIYDEFGYSLGLSGDGNRLLVGAISEASASKGINANELDNTAEQAGAAYLFERLGSLWSQTAYLKASNSDSKDYFGNAVSLSSDGRVLAIGASQESGLATGVGGNQAENAVTPAPLAGISITASAGAVYLY